MDITVPKERNQTKWIQNQTKLQKLQNEILGNERRFTFKQYCEYSIYFIQADDQAFLNHEDRVSLLTNPTIQYIQKSQNQQRQGGDQKFDQMFKKQKSTGEKIVNMIKYAWTTIIELIKGKKNRQVDTLNIYNDENIGIHFARLEEVLTQLSRKKYRIEVLMKENAYINEMHQKEMDEELTFIKLLKSIIQQQTSRLKKAHQQKSQPKQEEKNEHNEDVQQRLEDIKDVVKVKEYFQRKLAVMKQPSNHSKDPIDRQKENRRFNAAAVRFHLHYNHIRR